MMENFMGSNFRTHLVTTFTYANILLTQVVFNPVYVVYDTGDWVYIYCHGIKECVHLHDPCEL